LRSDVTGARTTQVSIVNVTSVDFGALSLPANSLLLGLIHIGVFFAKMAFFMIVFIWVRWMLPRFRYDQLMDLGWRRFIPMALANIVVTAIVVALFNN